MLRCKAVAEGFGPISPVNDLGSPVEQIKPERASLPVYCYSGSVEHDHIRTPNRQTDAASLDELAASQGVIPVTDFDSLLGHPSSEDESVDEFSAMLREWRCEGTAPARRQ